MGIIMDKNKKAYGNLLKSIRKYKGISEELLAHGMFDKSMIYRIESGQRRIGFFSRRRLMSRLGISLSLFTEYLQYDEYEAYSKQREIIYAFENEDTQNIESVLVEYEKTVKKDKVGLQFALFIRAVLESSSDLEMSYEYISKCIKITMPNIKYSELSEYVLSGEEVRYLSYYLKIKSTIEKDTIDDDICGNLTINGCFEKLLDYIIEQKWDTVPQMQVFPAVLVDYWNYLVNCRNDFLIKNGNANQTVLKYLNYAFYILKESGLLFYLPSLLTMGKTLSRGIKQSEYEKYDNVFRKVFELSGNEYNKENPWTVFYGGSIYLLGDVLKRRRILFGMTQKEFCEGICDIRTYSRLETGKAKTHDRETIMLLKKARLPEQYFYVQIVSDDYSLIKDSLLINKLINESKYNEANNMLLLLENKIDMSIPINSQFIGNKIALASIGLKEIDKNCYGNLARKYLHLTIDKSIGDLCISKMYFTSVEYNLIYNLVRYGELQKKIFDGILTYFTDVSYLEKRHRDRHLDYIVWYFASYLGDHDDKQKSTEISKILLKNTFLKMNREEVTKNIYNILWNKYDGNFAGSTEAEYILSVLLNVSEFYKAERDMKFFNQRLKEVIVEPESSEPSE